MTDFLKSHAKSLFKLGYPIVPIGKGFKYPSGEKYEEWQKIVVTPAQAKKWIADPSMTGVGVLTATTPAIDIDLYEADAVEMVLNYLTEKGLYDWESIKRTGENPKVLIPYRLEDGDDGFRKIQSSVYKSENSDKNKIEILGIGQQFVAYHIHPDIDQPYHYNGGNELTDLHHDELTTLNAYQAKDLVDWFEATVVPELGWELKGRKRYTSIPDSDSKTDIDILDNVTPPLEIGDFKVIKTLEGLPNDLDYDDWLNVGFALWHQYNGSELGYNIFQTWTSLSPKYEAGYFNKAKWESFRPDYSSKPITFAFVLDIVDPHKDYDELSELRVVIQHEEDEAEKEEEFHDADRQGEFILPKKGSKGRKKLDRFLSRYTFVGHKQLIIDKSKPSYHPSMEWKDFEKMHINKLIEVNKPLKTDPDNTTWKPIPSLWLGSTERETVTGFKYAPGEKRFFKDDTNTKYANMFAYPDHAKIAAKCKIAFDGTDRLKIFFDHIDYVFPNKEERKWFLQWIAFTIQAPHKRCPIAPIHVARTPGIGRSWILRAITRMMGPENVNTVDIEQIIGDNGPFNDHLVDCKVIACEELRIGESKDRYKVENTLKSDITDSRKQIRRKYGTQMTENIYGNFLFWTNYSDAIPIPIDDRRYNVFSGPLDKKSSAYYDNLMNWLDDFNNDKSEIDANIAQLFHFFSTLDISKFDVSAPMDTPARRAMINMSKSDTEHLYDGFLAITNHTVMSAADVCEGISQIEGLSAEPVDISRVSGVLRQKATSLGRVTVKGKQERLWSLNNINHSQKEAAKLYTDFLNNKHNDEFSNFD